jgi:hypothetical protein
MALDEEGWTRLVEHIQDRTCTPFVGAGASVAQDDSGRGLPTGKDLAERWAAQYDIPAWQSHDLAKVAQAMAVQRDAMFPKDQMLKVVRDAAAPDFGSASDPHGVLARLPFRIYLTTNYDDYLVRSLQAARRRPHRYLSCWHDNLRADPKLWRPPRGQEPSDNEPFVFHLHGHADSRQSLVLTEDDYLEFLVAATINPKDLLPAAVRTALMSTSLLFIGYSITDWSFRVVFKSLLRNLPASIADRHIAVQLDPEDDKQRTYLDQYYGGQKIDVFWGSAAEFALKLSDRTKGLR